MAISNLIPQAVFLDRDGTIGGSGKLLTPDEFVLYSWLIFQVAVILMLRHD